MVEDLVPDSLWDRVALLLPSRPPRRRRFPGRKPVDDRVALAGMVFVLKTGITWNELPAAVVGCSGVTCWRRVRDWTEAGCGRRCMSCCWPSCAPPGCSIWIAWPSTPRTCTRSKGGPRRPVTGQPRPSRFQAPPDRRRARRAIGGNPDRRQPPRRHPAAAATRRRPADSRTARSAPTQAPRAVRRPRLRLRQVPTTAARARHPAAHCPPRYAPGGIGWLSDQAGSGQPRTIDYRKIVPPY